MYPGGHMIWMAFGWLLSLAVGTLIIWFLLTVLTSGLRKRSPEEILRQRLANGEIDIAEYGLRLMELSKNKRAA